MACLILVSSNGMPSPASKMGSRTPRHLVSEVVLGLVGKRNIGTYEYHYIARATGSDCKH